MRTYNIFISHSWSYSDSYDRLVELLDDAKYFNYKNYSVPKEDPIHNAPSSKKLEQEIKKHMNTTHVVVVLAGVYATYSKWITKEIDLAKNGFEKEKKILAIKLWDSERASSIAQEKADAIVGWNGQSIADKIKELANS